MPLSLFARTLVQARTPRRDGDASAWAHYVECCLRLEAEHQQLRPAARPSRTRRLSAQRRAARTRR